MHLWIQCMPIRESRSQRSFDSFTGLIAVFHALHRLLAPRHPPHALSSLAALILSSARLKTLRTRAQPPQSLRSGLARNWLRSSPTEPIARSHPATDPPCLLDKWAE